MRQPQHSIAMETVVEVPDHKEPASVMAVHERLLLHLMSIMALIPERRHELDEFAKRFVDGNRSSEGCEDAMNQNNTTLGLGQSKKGRFQAVQRDMQRKLKS